MKVTNIEEPASLLRRSFDDVRKRFYSAGPIKDLGTPVSRAAIAGLRPIQHTSTVPDN